MYAAGIDIGSVSTEAVLLRDGRPAGSWVQPTGSSSRQAAERIMSTLLTESGIDRRDLGRVVTTGYGRNSSDLGDGSATEIKCHARGAWHLDNRVRMVVDIGGQDSKVIKVGPGGRSLDFLMNDKCAAGTGRFLEIIARTLELDITDLGPLALQAGEGVTISSMCAVFAESEVVSLIAQGYAQNVIIRGIAESVAGRVAGMARRIGMAEPVMLTGGVAQNEGVAAALERVLGVKVRVPAEPQIVGALGAACIAAEGA
jgi:predicted CoA-substrate-specific enzyme activase